MDVYAENILDHYRDPRGQGDLESPDAKHEEVNHSCGDAVTLHLKLEGETIAALRWEGTGCAISQAAMSMLSDELEGMSTADALALTKADVYAMLGVPIGPRRFKCALLGLHTVKNALRKAQALEVQSWLETVEVA